MVIDASMKLYNYHTYIHACTCAVVMHYMYTVSQLRTAMEFNDICITCHSKTCYERTERWVCMQTMTTHLHVPSLAGRTFKQCFATPHACTVPYQNTARVSILRYEPLLTKWSEVLFVSVWWLPTRSETREDTVYSSTQYSFDTRVSRTRSTSHLTFLHAPACARPFQYDWQEIPTRTINFSRARLLLTVGASSTISFTIFLL